MFQLYASGPDFLRENQQILQKEPLQTAFFVSNAQAMPEIQNNAQGFIVRVAEEEKVLLAIRCQRHPMVLYGDRSLCEQLTDGLVEHGLTFRQVLAQKELMEMFLICYLRSQGGDFRLLRGLELMGWKGEDLSILPPDSSEPAQRLQCLHPVQVPLPGPGTTGGVRSDPSDPTGRQAALSLCGSEHSDC